MHDVCAVHRFDGPEDLIYEILSKMPLVYVPPPLMMIDEPRNGHHSGAGYG